MKGPNSNIQAPTKLQNLTSKKHSGSRRMGAWNFRSLLFWCLALGFWNFTVSGAELSPVVSAWLNAQTNIHTWSADFTQTRTLKSLARPLTATGHVWFEAPNRFRWELGHPAQTIAVREPDEMLVIYPRLKRVERYPLGGSQSGQWHDVMSLLDAGFPRSQADLESEYDILGRNVTGDICELTLQPKSAMARKMMPQIKIGFSTKDFSLRSTELEFADGSTLRNDFRNAEVNPKLDESLFAPKLPSDYRVSEPLQQQ